MCIVITFIVIDNSRLDEDSLILFNLVHRNADFTFLQGMVNTY